MELVGALAASEKTKQVYVKVQNKLTYYSHSAFGVSQQCLFYRIVGQEIHKNVTPLPGEKN
jgi:hypothetical protein